jgi:hypothetical protein
MKTLLYTIVFVLNVGMTLALQIWDKRRLTDEQRRRAWNTASWGAALMYAFFIGGAASMIPWAWVTRQDWRRWRRRGLAYALLRSVVLLLLGAAAALAVYVLLGLVASGLAPILGVPDD